jgi:hypothetical protein
VNYKAYIQSALLITYLSVVFLANGGGTVCITEQSNVQFEFGPIVCELSPLQPTSSTPAGDCGDCTDATLKTGETRRFASRNNFGVPPIPNAIVCHVLAQKTSLAQTYIEPESSAPDLAGSIILII